MIDFGVYGLWSWGDLNFAEFFDFIFEEVRNRNTKCNVMLGQIDGVRFEGSDLFLPVQCFGDRVIISGTLMTRQD